jgi:hypothetical protein
LNSFCAWCTVYSFCCKHWIIFCSFTFQWHEKIVQILQIFLKKFMSFIIFNPINNHIQDIFADFKISFY